MFFARRRRSWELSGLRPTDERIHEDRRRFLLALGAGGLAASSLALGTRRSIEARLVRDAREMEPLTGRTHPGYASGGRPLTPVGEATRFTNFFEFGAQKRAVPSRARDLSLDPYALFVDGLVEEPGSWTLERIEALGLEERVYRHRCVEAWAMTIPWVGVPLAALLRAVGPLPDARFVSFQSFDPHASALTPPHGFPFPYYEALGLEEATHPLAFLASGCYGHRLTPQNGAPVRLVLPWKYGYKGAKSLVRVTLSSARPPSFWNDVAPGEYSWLANVDPATPHPRWSQATERLLGSGDEVATLPFNGYDLGSLYA